MTIDEIGAALARQENFRRRIDGRNARRVADANPRLNAFITVTEAAARTRAMALDDELARGLDRGPLHGIPIGHKDNIFTRGVRTTGGSKIFADFVPDYDATIVSQLNDAGANVIGKTGLHEFAYGITSNNPHFGAIRNPWDAERVPGGSSGGSAAAVAAASGTFGHGLGHGRIDPHPGLVLRRRGFEADLRTGKSQGRNAAGADAGSCGCARRHCSRRGSGVQSDRETFEWLCACGYADLRGMRIGVPENFFVERIAPEVMLSFRAAVQTAAALGAHVTEIKLPDGEALNVVGRIAQLSEVSALLARYLDRRDEIGTRHSGAGGTRPADSLGRLLECAACSYRARSRFFEDLEASRLPDDSGHADDRAENRRDDVSPLARSPRTFVPRPPG